MNLQKLAENRILKPILSRSKYCRILFAKLWLYQRKRKHVVIAPAELVEYIGNEAIIKKCKEAKCQKGDIQVKDFTITIV